MGYKYPSDCLYCGAFLENSKKAYKHKKKCEGGEIKLKTVEDVKEEISDAYALICLERMENDFKNLYFQRHGHDKEPIKKESLYPKYCDCGHVLTNKTQACMHKKVCEV